MHACVQIWTVNSSTLWKVYDTRISKGSKKMSFRGRRVTWWFSNMDAWDSRMGITAPMHTKIRLECVVSSSSSNCNKSPRTSSSGLYFELGDGCWQYMYDEHLLAISECGESVCWELELWQAMVTRSQQDVLEELVFAACKRWHEECGIHVSLWHSFKVTRFCKTKLWSPPQIVRLTTSYGTCNNSATPATKTKRRKGETRLVLGLSWCLRRDLTLEIMMNLMSIVRKSTGNITTHKFLKWSSWKDYFVRRK